MRKVSGDARYEGTVLDGAKTAENLSWNNGVAGRARARRSRKALPTTVETVTTRAGARGKPSRGPVGHEPTLAQRAYVTALRSNGATLANCASAIGISPNTLTKHYATELQFGFETVANRIGVGMTQKALAGDFNAMKFWLETHAGWGRSTRVRWSGPRSAHSFEDGVPLDPPSALPAGSEEATVPPPRRLIGSVQAGHETISVYEAE